LHTSKDPVSSTDVAAARRYRAASALDISDTSGVIVKDDARLFLVRQWWSEEGILIAGRQTLF